MYVCTLVKCIPYTIFLRISFYYIIFIPAARKEKSAMGSVL